MSLTTLPEATAVNVLIRHLTDIDPYPGAGVRPRPTREQAIDALVLLAASAHLKLSAGYDAEMARAALNAKWREKSTYVVVDQTTADAAAAYLYLRPFLGLSDLLPDGTPQEAPVRIAPLRALLAERHDLTTRAETAEDAFELLHARINRDFNFDAAESATPDDEYWARLMDDLVTFAAEVACSLETTTDAQKPTDPRHAPHQVTVTRLNAGFDLGDKREHELLIADNTTGGWISHLVQHPPACHRLQYGESCWFDDEWENGQFAYDDIAPGLYTVRPGHCDVGDHRGEYSHTEDYLHFERIGDAPKRPAPVAADTAGYSQEPPF